MRNSRDTTFIQAYDTFSIFLSQVMCCLCASFALSMYVASLLFITCGVRADKMVEAALEITEIGGTLGDDS